MNFRTNFNSISLISGVDIQIIFDDKNIKFVPPNLITLFSDLNFNDFYAILKQDISDFNKNINLLKFEGVTNRYAMLQTVLLLESKTNNKLEIEQILKKIFPEVEIINNSLFFNKKEISSDEFDLLFEFLLVSCGDKLLKDIQEIITKGQMHSGEIEKNKKLKEFELKKKEAEEKILAAKNKRNRKNKSNTKGSESKITIDQIVIAVMYEFPSLTIDRIYQMNLFTLLEFWKYVSKVVDNQIQIIAAGNGNIKKFTYFIN